MISVYHAHLWQPACHTHLFLLAMDLLMKKSSLFKQQKSESETNSCIIIASSVPADPTVAWGTVFPISALLLPVDAPAFLDGQEKLRLSLLKKLAEAIKEVSGSV